MYSLVATNLAKRFGRRAVFSDVSLEVSAGQALAVVGPNGSGKTTLLLALLGAHHVSRGRVTFLQDDSPLDEAAIRSRTVLVSPYLNLYDNLSAEENLVFFVSVAGGQATGRELQQAMERVGLDGRGGDLVRSYSSGMKQRLKYALALLRDPGFLFLDEPSSNLDEQGKKMVFGLVEEYRSDRVVVIATNEREEQDLAQQVCRLGG